MPRKTDIIPIKCPFMDRRTKMLPCQKERAVRLYNDGISINALAGIFKVNKRLIQFLLFPERQAKNLQDREDRGGTMAYYNKDQHRESIKEHRNHKVNIFNPKNQRHNAQ